MSRLSRPRTPVRWEVAVWLSVCVTGLIASALSLRLTRHLMHAMEAQTVDPDTLAMTRHLEFIEVERTLGWLLFVIAGLAGMMRALRGPVTTLLLIGAVVLWAYKTVSDYLFTRAMLRRANGRPTHV